MAILKCKMCGGDIRLTEGLSVAECEYCGTLQTVPNPDNEKKITLFTRANHLRAGCEFDKAAGIYESLIAEFPEEAEAYWGLILCTFGIEYVDDPGTGKKIPTCHRSSFESIFDDGNFDLVMEYADSAARGVYREEAKQIEELRKGIIEVSSREEPYDIFICYKETAENGERTEDSVMAQEVYDALTDKGYRVFFSRISLEDKLGVEYEPYIFSALNTAKIMLAFGTSYDYYHAVWVKNEWSRFLQLIAKGEQKKLIPCFKNIDAYDMPREFARLQAQDMGKIGAMQDLLRGIEKILPRRENASTVPVAAAGTATTETMLQRAFLYLEDGDWKNADAYCEKVLDIQPENPQAYMAKAMANLRIHTKEQLETTPILLAGELSLQKAVRYADDPLKTYLQNCIVRSEENHRRAHYEALIQKKEACTTSKEWEELQASFAAMGNYEDAPTQADFCGRAMQDAELYEKYRRAVALMQNNTYNDYYDAAQIFKELGDYMDCPVKIQECIIGQKALENQREEWLKSQFALAFNLIAAGQFKDASAEVNRLKNHFSEDARLYIANLLIDFKANSEEHLTKLSIKKKKLTNHPDYIKIMQYGNEETRRFYAALPEKTQAKARASRLIYWIIALIYMGMDLLLMRFMPHGGALVNSIVFCLPAVFLTLAAGITCKIRKDHLSSVNDMPLSIFFLSIVVEIGATGLLKWGFFYFILGKVGQGFFGLLIWAALSPDPDKKSN